MVSIPSIHVEVLVLYVLGMAVLMLGAVVLAFPDTLHHPDNLCYVDRYVTPKHIVPEWYFLPFYSMLRACSVKVIGVALLGLAVLVYIVLLLVVSEVHYSRGLHQGVVIMLVTLLMMRCMVCCTWSPWYRVPGSLVLAVST